MVCFGKKIWLKIKEIVYEKKGASGKRSSRRRKKLIGISEPVEGNGNNGSWVRCFSLNGSGIRIDPWWEKIKWDMIIDPENPFGDLTMEDERRIAELVKGMGKH